MKNKVLKTILIGLVITLCAVSFADAAVVCTVDSSSTGWIQSDQSTWISGVYTLKVNCTENGVPVAGYSAVFTATLNKGTYPYTKIIDLPINSTPTDSNGDAYINVPLIHEPIDGGGGYIHICPFDDINCQGGSSSPSINSAANLEAIAPPNATIYGSGCIGFIGCCEVTITVNCCNPVRSFTYCTYNTQYNCLAQNGSPDPCTTITATYNPTKVCNYCTGMCEAQTLISLSSFTAKSFLGRVKLEWATESEIDNAGFNIYRSATENGEYTKINNALILAKGSVTGGATYTFIDHAVKKNYYILEDVDINGFATSHGPISVAPKINFSIVK